MKQTKVILCLFSILFFSGFLFPGICSLGLADSPQQIKTIAGTGQLEDGGSQGQALQTNIGYPFGVEIGPDGALYICEMSNHRIRRLDLKTQLMATVAGSGKQGYSGDGGLATEALLNEPYEVRFDSSGNMYFVEMKNHIVRRVDRKSKIISTVAGSGQSGYSGDGGLAVKAKLNRPHSIDLDDQGYLYIADIGNHRIRVVNLINKTIHSFAGNGAKELPVDGETVLDKPILGPRALTVEGSTLWIALREGHSVWRLNLRSGRIHHVAGTGKKGFSGDGGPSKKANFNGPKGIAVGPSGNVFVVDTENQTIRKLNLSTKTISTVAGIGPGFRGAKGDGDLAIRAELNRPHGICIGKNGEIYIGDSENHRVRLVR